MKTKPILFSTAMVQALQNGSKTQTRRVVKPQPHAGVRESVFVKSGLEDGHGTEIKSPYGAVGDILWIRETWAKTTNVNSQNPWPNRPHTSNVFDGDDDNSAIIYRADGEWQWCDDDGFSTEKSYWKPSIFMPKAACRIFLKITGVRAERLQSIDEIDAIAEGIKIDADGYNCLDYLSGNFRFIEPEYSYQTLWQSINGPESWDANPWVWVVTFERCEKPEGFL